ncbi:MAG: exosortase/archaeosortase family protein [Fimbriiglobus sp.]|jgi:exosortase|nr:exosortase/archaeosortase family protein [Fimbriiglobus sp.]
MTTLTRDQMRTDRQWQLTVAAVVGGVLLAYSGFGGLGGISGLVKQWIKPDYSHGFIVVPFALYLLWRNRDKLPEKVAWPNWGGLPLLLGPLPLYLADADLNVAKEWVQGGCLVASLAGVLLMFGTPPSKRPQGPIDWAAAALCLSPVLYLLAFKAGNTSQSAFWAAVGAFALGVNLTLYRRWSAVRWAAPALGMLLLALPLPNVVENEVSWQLRKVATASAVGVFRVMGLPTRWEPPMKLDVGTAKLDVQAPCSGLSMLLAFVALTAAIVLLCPPSRRPIDRWVVFLSSVPIAVFCNIARIVVSGLVLLAGWKEAFDFIVHDFAGWAMMPLALGLVWAEFKLIDWLLVPVVRMSREEVVKAGLAEARAEIERQEIARRGNAPAGKADPHPAAPFLPLTPAGTSHGATAAGGTIANPATPPPRPGSGTSQ